MIRPLHNADHVVSDDRTIELRGLTPGHRVHVVVEDSSAEADPQWWGSGTLPMTRVYRPNRPRLPLGSLQTPGFRYVDPFEPACDPDEWEANR